MEQKPIRSPSMRLRFGRRNDPMMSLFNEVKFLEHMKCLVLISFIFYPSRKAWCLVTNRSLENLKGLHLFAFVSENAIHLCWRTRWENYEFMLNKYLIFMLNLCKFHVKTYAIVCFSTLFIIPPLGGNEFTARKCYW